MISCWDFLDMWVLTSAACTGSSILSGHFLIEKASAIRWRSYLTLSRCVWECPMCRTLSLYLFRYSSSTGFSAESFLLWKIQSMRPSYQGACFGQAPMENAKMESPQRCWSGAGNWLGASRRVRSTGGLHMSAHMCRLRLLAKIASGKGSGCQKKWRRPDAIACRQHTCVLATTCVMCAPPYGSPFLCGSSSGLLLLLAALQAHPYVSFYIQCGVNKQTATTKATSLFLLLLL